MSFDLERDLSIEEASSFSDYLFLRTLRNQVRDLMTNDTAHISYFKQLRLFVVIKCKFKKLQQVKIFIAHYKSRPAGYLMISQTQDGVRVTEAIDEKFRRIGIGKKLIEFAQCNYTNLVAEIREDNAASVALHESMGFRRENAKDGIVAYRFLKK
jgi:ribosomal protein S18 acetylase RimI-like enzyme